MQLLAVLILSALVSGSAYTTFGGIETGDVVNLDYVLSYDDEVQQEGPDFETEVSPNKLIQGFYEGLLGMKVGEDKEIVVPPDKGYTDPSHSLYGKFLYFDVHINKIVKNINGGGEVTEIASDLTTSSEEAAGSSYSGSSILSSLFESPVFRAMAAIIAVFYIYVKFLAN